MNPATVDTAMNVEQRDRAADVITAHLSAAFGWERHHDFEVTTGPSHVAIIVEDIDRARSEDTAFRVRRLLRACGAHLRETRSRRRGIKTVQIVKIDCDLALVERLDASRPA